MNGGGSLQSVFRANENIIIIMHIDSDHPTEQRQHEQETRLTSAGLAGYGGVGTDARPELVPLDPQLGPSSRCNANCIV